MLDKGWSLSTINEVIKANGLLDIHYESLRRYTNQQRILDEQKRVGVTPELVKATASPIPLQKQNAPLEKKCRPEVEKSTPYSVPPKFTGGRGDDDEDITTFLLGKGKK